MKFNFVLCPRFHGATVLALLLNNHSDVSSMGDMFPSSEFDQSCGCGEKVSKCRFWKMIDRKYHASRQIASGTMYPSCPHLLGGLFLNNSIVRTISLAARYSSPRFWKIGGGAAEQFIEFYANLIDTVNEYNQTSIFVNGAKSMTSVLSIKSILGEQAQVNIIHLVRDPRGFFCSENKDNQYIAIAESAKRWNSYHRRVTKLVQPLCDARYLAVRYEDLCEQPRSTLETIFEFIGVEYENVFHPPPTNHLIGHISKRQFNGTLRQSTKWRKQLSIGEQERCLALTEPLSGKFGYRMDPVPEK